MYILKVESWLDVRLKNIEHKIFMKLKGLLKNVFCGNAFYTMGTLIHLILMSISILERTCSAILDKN